MMDPALGFHRSSNPDWASLGREVLPANRRLRLQETSERSSASDWVQLRLHAVKVMRHLQRNQHRPPQTGNLKQIVHSNNIAGI